MRQPLRPPCLYSAPFAQRKVLRTAASAVGGLCQVPAIENGRYSDLSPAGRLLGCLDSKTEHSQSVCAFVHGSSFVPSGIYVSIKERPRATNKPGNQRWSPADLRGARKPLRRLERVRQVAVARTSRLGTAVDPRCPQTCWKQLSAESQGWGNGIPYQFTPAPLLSHIIWTCCKTCFQCHYAREKVLNFLPDSDGFL